MTRACFLALVSGALLVGTACDYDGSFLFADGVQIPSVIHLEGPDDRYLVPAVITEADKVRDHVLYAEVGAPLTAETGGVTMNFIGTGGDVCVWVDPELAFWNQKVGSINNVGDHWTYPDNVFDDGDLDLYVGYSAYYTGSEGEVMGDFFVAYTDSLGNSVPIELSACSNRSDFALEGSTAGRGSPEYCTLRGTDLGISYTVALRTFSSPLDDDRLGFGFLLVEGTCEQLKNLTSNASAVREECVITGEAIIPQGEDYGPWFGYDPQRVWPGSVAFETAFCDERMKDFCEEEAKAHAEAGVPCQWNEVTDPAARCYCGDPSRNPEIGAG